MNINPMWLCLMDEYEPIQHLLPLHEERSETSEVVRCLNRHDGLEVVIKLLRLEYPFKNENEALY